MKSVESLRHDPELNEEIRCRLEDQRDAVAKAIRLVQEAQQVLAAAADSDLSTIYNDAVTAVNHAEIKLYRHDRTGDLSESDTYIGNLSASRYGKSVKERLELRKAQ